MIKKILTIICTLLVMLSLASCGEYDKFNEELETLATKTTFAEAEKGATTLEEATDAVREQQVSLCQVYDEARKITSSEIFIAEYSKLKPDRVKSELSMARKRLNAESDLIFRQNLSLIMEDVTDCTNVEAYIEKRLEEVKASYVDYISLQNLTEDEYKQVTDIFIKYYDSKNDFAKWMLTEKEYFVAECATRSIEENGSAGEGHSAKLQKNNVIVTALNNLFGGVRGDTDQLQRIKDANKNLTSYVASITELYNKMQAIEQSN